MSEHDGEKAGSDEVPIAPPEWDEETPALTLARLLRQRGLPLTLMDH